jgi:hypothetical protein
MSLKKQCFYCNSNQHVVGDCPKDKSLVLGIMRHKIDGSRTTIDSFSKMDKKMLKRLTMLFHKKRSWAADSWISRPMHMEDLSIEEWRRSEQNKPLPILDVNATKNILVRNLKPHFRANCRKEERSVLRRDVEKIKKKDDCPICFEKVCVNNVCNLVCGHHVCSRCFPRLLQNMRYPTCPLCRASLAH